MIRSRLHSSALIAACLPLVSFALPVGPAQSNEAPTTRFGPVQNGPGGATEELSLWAPGRVMIQLTEEALDRSTLDRTWRGAQPAIDQATGVVAIDAELAVARVTGVRRALIEARNVVLERELGMHRWYLADVDPETDIQVLAERLRALPDVEDAHPDWRAFPAQVPNDPLHGNHWGHRNTGQMLDFCWGCGGHPSGSPVGGCPGAGTLKLDGAIVGNIQPIDGIVAGRQIDDAIIAGCIDGRLNSGGIIRAAVTDGIERGGLDVGGAIAAAGGDDRKIGERNASKRAIGLLDSNPGAACGIGLRG